MLGRCINRARRSISWAVRCLIADTPCRNSLRALALVVLPGRLVLPRNMASGRYLRSLLRVNISVLKDEGLIQVEFPCGGTLFTPARTSNEENWTRCWELLYDHWLHCCVLDQYFSGVHIETGMTVLDVGANVGAFTLAAARRIGPEGKLFLIEPDQENLRALQRCIVANDLPVAHVFRVAAGRSDGTLTLYRGSVRTGVNTTVASRAREDAEAVTVEQRAIDALVDEFEFAPDFIKIDVEGAELDVLSGAARTIRQCRPIIAAAAYHEPDHPDLIRQFIEETATDYRCELRCAAYDAESEIVAVPIERLRGSRA